MKETPETETVKLVMTVDETAKALRISRNSAFSRIHDGSLPAIRMGRRLLVPTKAISELLDVKPVSSSQP